MPENFEDRVTLARLLSDIHRTDMNGVIGLIELRNVLAILFPEFAEARDDELDAAIESYAKQYHSDPASVPGLD